MKKMKNYLLALVLSLCMIPIVAKADMGAPMTSPYDVVITNPNGVTIGSGKNKTTIPYDTKVTVNYEYEEDGELYIAVNFNGVFGDFKLSDAKVYTEDFDLSKFKLDNEVKIYIFKEGAYLYNGPSAAYGKVKGEVMIPVGTTVTYSHSDQMWVYVEYKGTKGWLYHNPTYQMYSSIENTAANPVSKDNKILFINKVTELNTDPKYNSKKVSVNIPAGTEITYDLSLATGRGGYVHIKYEGKEGWVDVSNYNDEASNGGIIESTCVDGIVIEDLQVYTEYNNASSGTNDVVPKGTNVHLIYSYRTKNYIWNKIKYDNKEVWVAAPSADYNSYIPVAYGSSTLVIYKSKSEVSVYEEPSASSKTVGSIKSGEKLTVDYSYYDDENWGYVEIGSIKGWVKTNDLEFDSYKAKESCSSALNDIADDKENGKEDAKENTLLKSALIAGAIAVVIGLTTTVVVILVNKKKNK